MNILKRCKSIIIFSVIVVLVFVSISYAKKVCPIDGKVWPDDYNYCIEHGVRLKEVYTGMKAYILTKDGKEEVMKFKNAFNTDCDGYSNKGIKYTDRQTGVSITIPWKEVFYILPGEGFGVKVKKKRRYDFTTEILQPSACPDAKLEEKRKKKVEVLGEVVWKEYTVSLDLSDIQIIAFSPEGLEAGRKRLNKIETRSILKNLERKGKDRNRSTTGTVLAVEVRNIRASQVGNRVLFEYDLSGGEGEEAEVQVTITVEGRTYRMNKLHLEGDYGKVKAGRGKKIYWNVLKDFPRGVRGSMEWEITAEKTVMSIYDTAIDLFQNGMYSKARNTFQSFLESHPFSDLSDNAQFWIAESYFKEKRYEDAILAYERMIKKWHISRICARKRVKRVEKHVFLQ